jgi:hypothetical protein
LIHKLSKRPNPNGFGLSRAAGNGLPGKASNPSMEEITMDPITQFFACAVFAVIAYAASILIHLQRTGH